jgi:hypothetical protein
VEGAALALTCCGDALYNAQFSRESHLMSDVHAEQIRLFKIVDAALRSGDGDLLAATLGSERWFDEPLPWGTGRDYPLDHAIHVSSLDFIAFMLNSGSNPNYPHNGFPSIATALGTAAIGGRLDHLDIVRLLIAHGADIHARDTNNWTPLHYATRTRNAGAIELLLTAGADPTLHDLTDLKSTPLDYARMYGFDDGIALLETA